MPQLWNVLRGEMSLVGPRPEDPGFVALHQDEYSEILTVRPGVTGLCQLAFAKESEILDPSDRLGHYVDRHPAPEGRPRHPLRADADLRRRDLRILLWTVLPVLVQRRRRRQPRDRRPDRAPSRDADLDLRRAAMTENMTDLGYRTRRAELLRIAQGLDRSARLDTRVVILAGGRGRRLEPYTSVLPKPLMPIGNRSILEILIHQLADPGFRTYVLRRPPRASDPRGVRQRLRPESRSRTTKEPEPLGTAGPLRLVDPLGSTTRSSYERRPPHDARLRALFDHHRESGNVAHDRHAPAPRAATTACSTSTGNGRASVSWLRGEARDDLEREHGHLRARARALIRSARRALRLSRPRAGAPRRGLPVGAYLFDGLWLDIGRHEDYEQAVELWAHGEDLVEEPTGPAVG